MTLPRPSKLFLGAGFALALLAGCTQTADNSAADAQDDGGDMSGDAGTVRRRDTGPRRRPDTGDNCDDTGDTTGDDSGVTGGDASSTPDGGPAVPTWYRDIQPIVVGTPGRCKLCHGHNPPLYGAPFPLMTYDDTQVKRLMDGMWTPDPSGTPTYQIMASVVVAGMPNPMPPSTQPQLTAQQKDLIRRWAEAGGPAGDAPDGGGPPGDAGPQPDVGPPDMGFPDASQPLPWANGGHSPTDAGTNLTWFDTFAHAEDPTVDFTQPYAPPVQTTTYYCFVFPIPPGSPPRHAIQFQPLIDNIGHVHHAFIFRVAATAMVPPTDGQCLGLVENGDLVGSWFPGRDATILPQGVGVEFDGGDYAVLQVHYDSVTTGPPLAPQQYDMSGIRMLLSTDPTIINAGLLWSGYQWADNSPLLGLNATRQWACPLPADMTLFGVIPHMHRHGTEIVFDADSGGNGVFSPIVDVQHWDFHEQPIYDTSFPAGMGSPVLQQLPIHLHRGDVVRTTCHWDVPTMVETNGGNLWGEGSGNEMCFTFMYIYPTVPNLRQCVYRQP